MSILKVDTIDAGSQIDFPNGFNVGGVSPAQVYTSSASAPSSSNSGDLWYDSTNKVLYQYVNNTFKEIVTQPAKFYPRNYKFVDSQKVSVSGYEGTPTLFTIGKDDQTVVISGTGGDDLELGRLSTAKDMSTLPSSPDTSLGSAQNFDTQPRGSFWHPDGDYLFACGTATDDIDRWSCPTPFSLAGASNDQTNTAALSSLNPQGLSFSPDGTKAFFLSSNAQIYKATLSTAWDVSTSSLTIDLSNYYDFKGVTGTSGTRGYNLSTNGGFWVSDDGYYCIVCTVRGGRGGTIHWGAMTTAWDITTLNFDPRDARPTNQEECQYPKSIAFSSDGSHMYVLDTGTNTGILYMEWDPE